MARDKRRRGCSSAGNVSADADGVRRCCGACAASAPSVAFYEERQPDTPTCPAAIAVSRSWHLAEALGRCVQGGAQFAYEARSGALRCASVARNRSSGSRSATRARRPACRACPYGIVRPDQPAGPWRPLSSRESSGAPAPSPKCRSAASSRRCECCGSHVRRAGSGP
jgi:hypothetical protein